MVLITEELVRKKAEHNEGIIGTLEELSLHQEDVEKIEHLNNWCKDIQILYLQANLISKIENLNKLKKLQYLNLAINNVETIENLERCESLEKLDLTLNFIGNLHSVRSLQCNLHLRDLYLTGNPCCDFDGYRQYVIVQLPQLKSLDSIEISKSERIKAQQNAHNVDKTIQKAQHNYRIFRKDQLDRLSQIDNSELTDEQFWKSTSENCPEIRTEIAIRTRKSKECGNEPKPKKTRNVHCFAKDGRPLNVNQAKLDFYFSDDDPKKYVLDIAIYKHLDSNLIDVDLQPIYVRISIKGKIFQIVFPEEIHVDQSTAKRSQTTGRLVLELPRVNYKELIAKQSKHIKSSSTDSQKKRSTFLEIPENPVKSESSVNLPWNGEVPPLEYG